MEHQPNSLQRRRWLAALLAVPALTFFAAQAANADALDAITKRGTLRVAVPEDYPPFGAVGPDMQPQGYDIDMAALLAKSMKVKLQLVPVNSANRIPYLQTDKVDLVISSLGKTPEREKVIDFSQAYAPYFQGVFRRTGGPQRQDRRCDARRARRNRAHQHGAQRDHPPLRRQ